MRPRPAGSRRLARAASIQILADPYATCGTLCGVKAIVASQPGPPDVLEVQDVETPSPGPNEVLIKVVAAGVNRADLLQRQGHYQPPPGAKIGRASCRERV